MEGKIALQACLPQLDTVDIGLFRIKAPYEYMSETDPKKGRKNYRGQDGKVITQSSNVLISPQAKIDYLKNKEFKYI